MSDTRGEDRVTAVFAKVQRDKEREVDQRRTTATLRARPLGVPCQDEDWLVAANNFDLLLPLREDVWLKFEALNELIYLERSDRGKTRQAAGHITSAIALANRLERWGVTP